MQATDLRMKFPPILLYSIYTYPDVDLHEAVERQKKRQLQVIEP